MYTVIETLVYARKADRLLTDDDRETFAAFISANPDAGPWCVGPAASEKCDSHRLDGARAGVFV